MTYTGEIVIIAAFLVLLAIYTLDFIMRLGERAEKKRIAETKKEESVQ